MYYQTIAYRFLRDFLLLQVPEMWTFKHIVPLSTPCSLLHLHGICCLEPIQRTDKALLQLQKFCPTQLKPLRDNALCGYFRKLPSLFQDSIGIGECLSSFKAAFELLPLTRQWFLPLRSQNEVNFSKVGNQALLKVLTFKRWQQGREGNKENRSQNCWAWKSLHKMGHCVSLVSPFTSLSNLV